MRTNWLANIFVWIREVIEEADKPLSMAITVTLPLIAPLLPALITSKNLRIYMELPETWTWIGVVAFEFIGYVGMIAVVGSIMAWIKDENNKRSWSNIVVSGSAYTFYLLALIIANLILELENGVPISHVAVTACLTVGLSVAASLLNGQRIFERNQNEKAERLRLEKRTEKLERYKIKHGKVSENLPKVSEPEQKVSENLPKDWRKLRPTLSYEQVVKLANLSADGVKQFSKTYNIDERTVTNWRAYAKAEEPRIKQYQQ